MSDTIQEIVNKIDASRGISPESQSRRRYRHIAWWKPKDLGMTSTANLVALKRAKEETMTYFRYDKLICNQPQHTERYLSFLYGIYDLSCMQKK